MNHFSVTTWRNRTQYRMSSEAKMAPFMWRIQETQTPYVDLSFKCKCTYIATHRDSYWYILYLAILLMGHVKSTASNEKPNVHSIFDHLKCIHRANKIKAPLNSSNNAAIFFFSLSATEYYFVLLSTFSDVLFRWIKAHWKRVHHWGAYFHCRSVGRERESIWCIVRQMNNGCVFINKIQKREEKTVAKLSLSYLLHDSFLIQILNDLYFKWIFFLDKTLSFCGWVSFVRATFIRLAECISIINSVI